MIKYKGPQGNIIEVEGRLFVTKSKNGKDVFAGDEIKMFSKQYKVVWDERELGWFLQDKYKAKIKLSHTNKNHIEEKEDEEHNT